VADNTVLYTAVYNDKTGALDDLNAVGAMHHDKIIGDYDAAVIDKEGGKARIIKRADRPAIRVLPEEFGSGTLPRKELKDAAQELTTGEAGLVVVGDVTLEKGLERALTHATNIAKRTFDETADQVSQELGAALKG
jgi:hypothetical protein